MKKKFLYIGSAILFLILVLPEYLTSRPVNTVSVKVNSIPDDLKKVFKNSCMDCHATGGHQMAMTKLNFTEWENYVPAQQIKKAVAICKIITNGKMPPKSFVKTNPDAVPTASQKEIICKWSETLAQGK